MINDWVDKQTNHQIDGIIERQPIPKHHEPRRGRLCH
jgi:hypothetical protein